ncbi:MAG: methyltransferase domain-containing protein [Chloroflexota bacterium]|nr:methyltransferase domain-containing protein [Chloroflexota bacterium]
MTQTPAQRFSDTAAAYAETMVPSLRPIAAEVVRRASLRPNERVLDLGTGTGVAAAAARGDGRVIVGVDAAPGMLEIARAEVTGVGFREMDFSALDFDDERFDLLIAAHSLLFATDRVAALSEWLRVTRSGGRLSLSVPGPVEVTPTSIYGAIYERYGIDTAGRYPGADELAATATDAGWADARVDSDPTAAIVLRDKAAFRIWRQIGSRGAATIDLTADQHRDLTDEMLAVTPRDHRGILRIPFGALFLTARRAA